MNQLKNLKQLAFDKVVDAIITQGVAGINANEYHTMLYVNESGVECRCAVGHLLPTDFLKEHIDRIDGWGIGSIYTRYPNILDYIAEGLGENLNSLTSVERIEFLSFLTSLQTTHDISSMYAVDFVREFCTNMKKRVCEKHNLVWNEIFEKVLQNDL